MLVWKAKFLECQAPCQLGLAAWQQESLSRLLLQACSQLACWSTSAWRDAPNTRSDAAKPCLAHTCLSLRLVACLLLLPLQKGTPLCPCVSTQHVGFGTDVARGKRSATSPRRSRLAPLSCFGVLHSCLSAPTWRGALRPAENRGPARCGVV